MASERRNGAGARLSGILERPALPDAEMPEVLDDPAGDAPEPKGRGAATRKTPPARAAKKIKGRTLYLDDALFERIVVQALRRGKTNSEYVAAILERQVPDHRVLRTGPAEGDAA